MTMDINGNRLKIGDTVQLMNYRGLWNRYGLTNGMGRILDINHNYDHTVTYLIFDRFDSYGWGTNVYNFRLIQSNFYSRILTNVYV